LWHDFRRPNIDKSYDFISGRKPESVFGTQIVCYLAGLPLCTETERMAGKHNILRSGACGKQLLHGRNL
jgi:hypothetical protein